MQAASNGARWLRYAVLGCFAAALIAGLFLPIYNDEIGWRLQERAAMDGVDKLYTSICGANTLVHPPFWMMPARYYSALFNSLFAAPIYVRLSGILYAFVLTGLILMMVRRVADGVRANGTLTVLTIGFLSMGTLPLLLVMSRPEQPVLLCLTAALLIALARKPADGDTPTGTAWWRSLGIVLLALVAMSYHVKGVATVPVYLACLAVASQGRRAVLARAIPAVALVALALWAGHYWVDRFQCPDDALLRAGFLKSTGPALVMSERSQILPLLAQAFANINVLLYPGGLAPRVEPMAGWLPIDQIDAASSFTWFLFIVSVWTITLIAMTWCLLCAARRAWIERRIDSRTLLAAALMALGTGWSATGFPGIYECTFTQPMLILALLLALSAHRGGPRFDRWLGLAATGIGLAGIASIALVAMIYGPSLTRIARAPGYVSGHARSITPFGYAGLEPQIRAAARKCGIVDPARQQRLVLDDLTYFPFVQSHMPEHRLGLFWPGDIPANPMGYLRQVKSSGIVSICRALPADLQARAKREGQFCCVAPADF